MELVLADGCGGRDSMDLAEAMESFDLGLGLG
jgi:hypothetical protein